MKRLLLWIAAYAFVAVAQDATPGNAEFVPVPPVDGQTNGFLLMRTEVSYAAFDAFRKATGYATHAEREGSIRNWREPGFVTSPQQPVTYVTPLDAAAYCSWIGGRLPTDAEWEHAARAGARTRHYWGDEIDADYLWYRANSEDSPQAVGSKRPNAFGLFDMEGNVWEWTLPNEPSGPKTLASRRGGSWVSCAFIHGSGGRPPSPSIGTGVYYRVPVNLHHRYDDIGFRCAKDLTSALTTDQAGRGQPSAR